MTISRALFAVFFFPAIAVNVSAADLSCGTSDEIIAAQSRLAEWTKARQEAKRSRFMTNSAPATARYDSGVFIVRTDDNITPFDKPFALRNSSLYFARAGAAFTVRKAPLVYNPPPSSPWASFTTWTSQPYTLSFSFPFRNANYNTIYITPAQGIFFAPPGQQHLQQFGPLEILTQRAPVIAPLLYTSDTYDRGYNYANLIPSLVDVYVDEDPGTSVTITWKSRDGYAEDVQARLFSNGDIRFSYRTVETGWGAVMVTSGDEAWYDATTPLASDTDASGDVSASFPAALRGMLDIQSASVRRVANSNLLEFTIGLGAAIDPTAIPAGQWVDVVFRPGDTGPQQNANRFDLLIYPDAYHYVPPSGWNSEVFLRPALNDDAGTYTVSGSTITVRVVDELLAIGNPTATLNIQTLYTGSPSPSADSMTMSMPWGSPTDNGTTLFENASTTPSPVIAKPLVEAFTLPVVNVDAVWALLKSTFAVSDADIDAVSVYGSFDTNLLFYADGFSTIGNPGVDGIGPPPTGTFNFGSVFARRAELLNVGRLGYGPNATGPGFLALLGHEFAHRWLYRIPIVENGSTTYDLLGPDKGHPKRGTHLPAAFPVFTYDDYSLMGGSNFKQTGPLTYRTPPAEGAYGYSWSELYLMGLADASEVPPWFYLNGAGLEKSYNPPVNTEFTVTARNDVVMQQVLDANGARFPSAANSQKLFKDLFVLLERPSAPASSDAITSFTWDNRDYFELFFSVATNGRGKIVTVPDSIAVEAKFKVTQDTPSKGTSVNFVDFSTGDPTTWSWDFGDGGTSADRDPVHAFSTSGTFTVALTASKTGSSSTVTLPVTIGGDGTTSTTAVPSATPVLFGQNVTITASVNLVSGTGSPTGQVTFRDGTRTLGTAALSGSNAAVTTAALGPGSHSITAIYGGDAAFSGSTSAPLPLVITLAAPQTIVAAATVPPEVQVSWAASPGATSYDVLRSASGNAFTLVGNSPTSPFIDTTASKDTAYLYVVQARGGADGSSPLSNTDLVSTVIFDDDLVISTTVKALHINQLQKAVTAVRTLAGLPSSFVAVTTGAPVSARDITDLRTALAEARAVPVLGLPPAVYQDPALDKGALIRRAHILDLRHAVQ